MEEARGGMQDGDFGVSVFAVGAGDDLAAERMHHEMQSVTDAEDGKAEFDDALIGWGRIGVVDGRGAAGEDDADGSVAADFVECGGAGENDGEDVELANSARDELSVLRAEVEDDDGL